MSSRNKLKNKLARRNGALAAGAKTPEGLQRSAMNALRHGLTAKSLVLSNESQAKFDELLQSFIEEFNPQGTVELGLVTDMAAARWRLQRIWIIQTNAIDFQMDIMEAEVDQKYPGLTQPARLALAFTTMANEQHSLQLLLRYESNYRRAYSQAQRDLLKFRESMKSEELPNEPQAPAPVAVSKPKTAPKLVKITDVQRPQADQANTNPPAVLENEENNETEQAPTPKCP
jgi:hypothetical protein